MCPFCQRPGPPFPDCRSCGDQPSWHHGRCCPMRPGGAGIPAAQPQQGQPAAPTQQGQQRQGGGAGINAAPPRAPPATVAARTDLDTLLQQMKMPAFHWRQILSAHNTTRPGGRSINVPLKNLLVWGGRGHRLTLDLPNSYNVDDGLAVAVHTDLPSSKSQAKAQVAGKKFVHQHTISRGTPYTYVYIAIYT